MERDPPLAGQTPIDDLSGLRVRLRTQAELNAAEAENIRKAIVKHLAGPARPVRAGLDVRAVLRLHHDMFGDVWNWAGTLRTRELNMGSAPGRIEVDLHNLMENLRTWKKSGTPSIEQAARLHHGAVRIHPFLNGNGRWARMLANVWLRRLGGRAIEWPEATVGTSSVIRDEYLVAIRAADRGEFTLLIALHERFVGGGGK